MDYLPIRNTIMKKHIVLISVGVLNILHGSFHIVQFIQSMFFVAYATHDHSNGHEEGFVESVMHNPIFALLMGLIGILTLVIGIRDYRHHKKCEHIKTFTETEVRSLFNSKLEEEDGNWNDLRQLDKWLDNKLKHKH